MENRPASQSMHNEAFTSMYLPAAQTSTAEAPAVAATPVTEEGDGMRSTAAESSGRHDRYCVAGGNAGGAGSSTGVHTAAAD